LQVIPAIDIRGGKCVRLLQGDFARETVFSDDPVEMAVHWASQGAPRLHVVDLDGARTGVTQNAAIISKITLAVDIPVQMGGGVRTPGIARQMLNLGVDRVVVGTAPVLDRKMAAEMFGEFGDRLALGLDARGGLVATHGWQENANLRAIEFAQEMESLGARRIIYTDISRDGMLEGVNVDAVEQIARAVHIPIIASGGVSSLEDIRRLKDLESCGVEGVIVGRALYTGAFDLREAIEVAS